MNTGVILGIVIIILSLCLVYIGIMGLMGKATNKKIAALPKEIRPKAARIYGIGSLVTAAGAAVLGLHSMRTLIGFDIPEYIGLIGIGLGLAINISAQRIRK